MAKYARKLFRKKTYRKRRFSPKKRSGLINRRPRYYKRKSGLSAIRVKCNGQVQPFGKYVQKPPYWKAKLEKLYFTASKNCYRQLGTTQLTNSNGSQAVAQQFIWSASDITAMLNTVSALGPTASGQTRNTNRVYLQTCDASYTFTNSANTPVEFDIYIFNSKLDAEDSLVTVWESGIQDMIGSGVPDTNQVQYGITPLNNPAVSQYYKCIKILHYVVSPGQMFKYTHSSNLYRLWNNERLNSDLQTDAYFKGISQTILFVAKGAPASQTVNTTLTTTATCKINVAFNKEYRFKYIEDRNYNMNDVTDLTNTATSVYNMSGQGASDTVTATVI